MASPLPAYMRALVAVKYGKPEIYKVEKAFPTPTIRHPNEVIIRAFAASINPIDVKMASGMAKMLQREKSPFQIGYDVAGVVVRIGAKVTRFKTGDAVYARVPNNYRGSVADYVLTTEDATALKPPSLNYIQAASMPLACLTAFQCLRKADNLLEGGLKGKNVLVPAGLSGTGSFAIQLAKNVFGARRVITTLSTQKIPKAREILGAETFEAIDYTKVELGKVLEDQSIDYLFDTMGLSLSLLGKMTKGGVICSISTIPSGTAIKYRGGADDMPTLLKLSLDSIDYVYRWWARRYDVNYSYVFMEPKGEDLEELTGFLSRGLIKPVVGRVADLDNEQAVIAGCQQIYAGQGGLGKFVIKIIS